MAQEAVKTLKEMKEKDGKKAGEGFATARPHLASLGDGVWVGDRAIPAECQSITVLGAPLGTPAYIQAFLTDTLAKHIPLLHSIPALHDLQASWLLLVITASPRCNYLLRLLPPDTTRQFAEDHDAAVASCSGPTAGRHRFAASCFAQRRTQPWQLFGRRGQTPCQFYINKRRRWRQHSATSWLIQPAYPTPKGPSKPENASNNTVGTHQAGRTSWPASSQSHHPEPSTAPPSPGGNTQPPHTSPELPGALYESLPRRIKPCSIPKRAPMPAEPSQPPPTGHVRTTHISGPAPQASSTPTALGRTLLQVPSHS